MTREKRRKGTDLKPWEWIAGNALLVLGAILLLPAWGCLSGDPQMRCQTNLKELGAAFRMYAEENAGAYPPVQIWSSSAREDRNRTRFMANGESIFPAYISDPRVLTCPEDKQAPSVIKKNWQRSRQYDPCLFDDTWYTYTGWLMVPGNMLNSDGQGLDDGFARAVVDVMSDGMPFKLDADSQFSRSGGGGVGHLLRLRAGIENHEGAPDGLTPASIPIMFDTFGAGATRVDRHGAEGVNTLYMDGHVAFVPKGEFPCVSAWPELRERVEQAEPLPLYNIQSDDVTQEMFNEMGF